MKTFHSALFVDFDNFFLRLADQRHQQQASNSFATNPSQWFEWVISSAPQQPKLGSKLARRIDLAKVYLNPNRFSMYRQYFTRSGFEVVDCPSLTQQGKSAADIQMTVEILEALNRHRDIDEFILMSGDSDFTPVLRRLRAQGRRTMIIVPGFAAQAYIRVADIVVFSEKFISDALGVPEQVVETSSKDSKEHVSEDESSSEHHTTSERGVEEDDSANVGESFESDHLSNESVVHEVDFDAGESPDLHVKGEYPRGAFSQIRRRIARLLPIGPYGKLRRQYSRFVKANNKGNKLTASCIKSAFENELSQTPAFYRFSVWWQRGVTPFHIAYHGDSDDLGDYDRYWHLKGGEEAQRIIKKRAATDASD